MKAAVVRSFGEPLVIKERPDPEPGPGQVRIRVEACGLCHTDIHAAHRHSRLRTRPLRFPPLIGRHLLVPYFRTWQW